MRRWYEISTRWGDDYWHTTDEPNKRKALKEIRRLVSLGHYNPTLTRYTEEDLTDEITKS